MKQYRKGYSKKNGKYTIEMRSFLFFWVTAVSFHWEHKRDRHLVKLEEMELKAAMEAMAERSID
tara:strand:+ start:633 stop:824 length:192 start_codon:yes stop_codon:yes gene_type:complete